MAQKVLMRIPHHSAWGTCLLQNWIPRFNSSRPVGLKVPTWVILKAVPDEFVGVIKQIAQSLGEILGINKRNTYSEDQRFCIALLSGMPYETILGIVNPVTRERSEIVIDYNNLPIRCRYCMAIEHLIKDCPGLNEGKSKEQEGDIVNPQSSMPAPNAQSKTQETSAGSGRRGSGTKMGSAHQGTSRTGGRREGNAQSCGDNEAQSNETQVVRETVLEKDTS
jgi:hypothetical protein